MLRSSVDAHVVVGTARNHVPIVVIVQLGNGNVRRILVDVSKLKMFAHPASRFRAAIAHQFDYAITFGCTAIVIHKNAESPIACITR